MKNIKIKLTLLVLMICASSVLFTSCDDGECFEGGYNKSQSIEKAAPGTVYYPTSVDC